MRQQVYLGQNVTFNRNEQLRVNETDNVMLVKFKAYVFVHVHSQFVWRWLTKILSDILLSSKIVLCTNTCIQNLLILFFVHEGIIRFAYKYLFQTGFIVAAGLLKKIELEGRNLCSSNCGSSSVRRVPCNLCTKSHVPPILNSCCHQCTMSRVTICTRCLK